MNSHLLHHLLSVGLELAAHPLVYVVIAWLFGPIVVFWKFWQSMRPIWEHAELTELPPKISQIIADKVAHFAVAGFEPLAVLRSPRATANVGANVLIMKNTITNDLAFTLVAQPQSRSRPEILVFWVESRFEDGVRITTGVNPQLSAFPRDPMEQSANFVWVTSVAAICEAHRRRLDQLGMTSRRRCVPARGQEIAMLNRDWDASGQRRELLGYQYREQTTDVYRLTWKGALLCSWRLVQPTKAIRAFLRDHKARRLWRELGMDRSNTASIL